MLRIAYRTETTESGTVSLDGARYRFWLRLDSYEDRAALREAGLEEG